MLEYEEVQVNKAKAMAYVVEFNTTKSYDKLVTENPWFSLPLHEINVEQILEANLELRLADLAKNKAEETGQNFEEVYNDLQHQFYVKFAEYLATTIDPILATLEDVVEIEKSGRGDHNNGRNVCGICLDEMVHWQNIKGMACKHSFHGECIYKWLRLKLVCPMCRSKHEI